MATPFFAKNSAEHAKRKEQVDSGERKDEIPMSKCETMPNS
jgi:hypothetical protein